MELHSTKIKRNSNLKRSNYHLYKRQIVICFCNITWRKFIFGEVEKMKKSIAVIFQGTGYTCEEQLLVGCAKKYAAFGYDIVKIDFSEIPFREIETIKEAVEIAKPILLTQLKKIDFKNYDNVVFISKSFGTICAGWLEEYLSIMPQQIFLTPIEETLPYVKKSSRIIGMVVGTEDRLMNYNFLKSYCAEKNIPCIVFNSVGHSLKYENYPEKTNAINEQIYNLCRV